MNRKARSRYAPSWKTVLGASVAAVLLYFAAMSGRGVRQDVNLQPAPDFSLPDVHGRPLSLSSFRGQVVLLDFWATWCEPCQEELPDLKSLHLRHKDRGFTVLGVSMDALGAKAVAPFLKEKDVPYPVVLTEGEPPSGYPVIGLPTAFLIDRKGLIVRRYLGPQSYEDLARDVEELAGR
jgi:peroxiredoxin